MNFSKNPFIGANKIASTKSNVNNNSSFGRANVDDIRQNMQSVNMNQKKQARDLVKQREDELKRQHEAFADQQRMFNPNKASGHANQVQAQNSLMRGFKNGR